VLDVIVDEELAEHARCIGEQMTCGLEQALASMAVAARGRGLLVGVEVETAEAAELVVSELRNDAILIGRTGRNNSVLKIRPPLAWRRENAKVLVDAVVDALRQSGPRALRGPLSSDHQTS